MRHWERLNLRRGLGQFNGRRVRNRPKNNGHEGSPAVQANEDHKPTAEQNDHPKERPFGTWAEITIAATTIVLAVVSYLQWGAQSEQIDLGRGQLSLAENQFGFARNEAEESSNAAAASLSVSDRAATATADQAKAMKRMAEAAATQATAAREQAQASQSLARSTAESLQFQRSGDLDIDADFASYEVGQRVKVLFTVKNVGPTTIRNAELFVGVGVMPISRLTEDNWKALQRPINIRSLARGETFSIPVPWNNTFPLTQEFMEDMAMGRFQIAASAMVRFRNPGQAIPEERRECFQWYDFAEDTRTGRPTRRLCDPYER